MYKKLLLPAMMAIASVMTLQAQGPATETYVECGKHHVQGLAYDEAAGRMYFSFTTSFIKTDMEGNVLGSIEGIQGHLGAMVFDKAGRKAYASLECKDDAIGAGLSLFAKGRSMFYIAIIDVDKVTRVGMASEDNEAFKVVCIKEAATDYLSKVSGPGGEELEHLYGCSGIDGLTIAPKVGRRGGRSFLYVAYGIYGDPGRSDNDYQVLLRYDIGKLHRYAGTVKFGEFYDKGPSKPLDKYFIFTGNTKWGVQNLVYDPFSRKMFMFVYKGEKERFANYDAFCFDMGAKPVKRALEGVSYDTSRHKVLGSSENPVEGFRFKYGSTGACPLGDGRFYLSESGSNPGNGLQYCRARIYSWDGSTFVPSPPPSR